MSILSTLKNTFLPSAEVSAARRQATFGTTSKAVAATAIVGAAAVAIAAPAVIASAPARAAVVSTVKTVASTVTKAVGSAFIKSPVATSAAVLVGAPVIAGIVSTKPSLIYELPKKSFEAGSKLVNVIEDNPLAAGAIGSVAGGIAAYQVYDAVFGKDQSGSNAVKTVKDSAEKFIGDNVTMPSSSMPSSSPTGAPAALPATPDSAMVPVTPATQVLGKPAGSSSKRKKTKKQVSSTMPGQQSVRVNIYNQTKSLYTQGLKSDYVRLIRCPG